MRESNLEVFGLFYMLFFRFAKGLSHILLKGNVCGRLDEEDGNSALDKENYIKTITQPFSLSCFSTILVNLYCWKDAFGIVDNLIDISNMKFVLLPNKRIKIRSFQIIFYGIVFL